MKLFIEIDNDYYEILKHDVDKGMDYLPCVLIANGTPLDRIIADIEAARDKDKLCEYPYNRCIDILRRAGE